MSTIDAISGLLVSSNALDIISNNIANASTIGFKSSSGAFSDMVSNSSSAQPSKGSGVRMETLVQNFNNGTLINTGKDLDISINKTGFFRILDNNGYIHYTRNGQFSFDKNQNIINMQGMYLTGQAVNRSLYLEKNINNLEVINLKKYAVLPAKTTKLIKFNPILHANKSNNIEKKLLDYNTRLKIYGPNYKTELIDINFIKKANIKNKWMLHITSHNDKQLSHEKKINSAFDINFDSEGNILLPDHPLEIKYGSFWNDKIIVDLHGIVENPVNYRSFIPVEQDGYPEGILKAFDILKNGSIVGKYSNEKMIEISQIILAKFISPEKLHPEGSNMWSATEGSGHESLGIAGSIGFGTLRSKALEASNVDLNKELINMIIAQRNYQSNAQALKTEDKIIATLINLR